MQTAVANCSVSCKISPSTLGMTFDSYLLGLIHSYKSQTAAVMHMPTLQSAVSQSCFMKSPKEERQVFSPWLNCPNTLRAAVLRSCCAKELLKHEGCFGLQLLGGGGHTLLGTLQQPFQQSLSGKCSSRVSGISGIEPAFCKGSQKGESKLSDCWGVNPTLVCCICHLCKSFLLFKICLAFMWKSRVMERT